MLSVKNPTEGVEFKTVYRERYCCQRLNFYFEEEKFKTDYLDVVL